MKKLTSDLIAASRRIQAFLAQKRLTSLFLSQKRGFVTSTGSGILMLAGGCLCVVMMTGCSVSGHVPTVRESFGLPDYGKPPGVRVKKTIFGASGEVSSDSAAKLDTLTFNQQTGSFELKGLDMSTNSSAIVKQAGENATALKELYAVNVEAKLKEIEMKEETKRELALAGIQAGEKLAEILAPFLNASPAGKAASMPGLLAGMLSKGIKPDDVVKALKPAPVGTGP